MIYKINNELSADIVDHEIAVLQRMPDLKPEELNDVDPTKLTPRETHELIIHNTRNVKIHADWLDLIRRVAPEDFDDKIRTLRDLHQKRLNENVAIITALQSGTLN
jgi:hypothetical protein